jgi:hypothetical protein
MIPIFILWVDGLLFFMSAATCQNIVNAAGFCVLGVAFWACAFVVAWFGPT